MMSNIFEKAIKKLCIDRSDWELVKFGDVAIQQKKSVDRDTTGVTKYVKGEHMYSEDLHLREWGELEDEYLGPAFIRLFDEGDILYGSRRTYLRKVTIAPFEGITSNTTFVMKANEKKIDKRLLPFVMLSEGFAEHSIKNSKGSVNPYVNWKDLADYEFLLPPKEQQAQLAELLWAMDEVIEKNLALGLAITNSYESLMNNFFVDRNKKGWNEYTIQELIKNGSILEIQDGNHGDIHPKASDYIEEGIPFVMANNLNNGSIDFSISKKLPQEITDKLRIGFAKPNDVLLSHKGTVGEVAIVPPVINWPYLMLTPQVTYYRPDIKKLDSQFLYYAMSSNYFQSRLKKVSSQSTRAYVGITEQKKLEILVPLTLNTQREVVNELHKFELNLRSIESQILASKSLQKSLINEVF